MSSTCHGVLEFLIQHLLTWWNSTVFVLDHAAILQTADHLPVLYCVLASLQWKRLQSTVWQHRLLDWHWAKSLQTRLMLPSNFSIRHVKNSEVSQMYHLRESLTLRRPYVNYVSWAAFWTVVQFPPATKMVKRKKLCCSCHVTAKGASTSSEELNVQMSLPTDDEYHVFQDQDQLQEH